MAISPDNPDNRTDLQAAIDSLSASGGGELIMAGPGTFDVSIDPVSTQGLKLKTGVTIRGTNNPVLRIKQGSTVYSPNALVWAMSANNIGLKSLTLDAGADLSGTPANQTTCLELRTVDGLTLQDVTFKNAIAYNVRSGGYGIVCWYGSTDNATVTGCTFDNNGQSDLGLFWGTNWSVSDCASTDTGYIAINVESTTGGTIDNVVIDGWSIDTCQFAAISSIQNASSTVTDVTIRNVSATDIHANENNVSIGGIRVRGTTRTTMENITVNGCNSHLVYVTVDSGYPVVDLTMRDVNGSGIATSPRDNVRSHGIWLEGTKTVGISGARFERVDCGPSTAEGMLAEFCTGLSMDPTSSIAAALRGLTLVGSTASLFAA